MGKADALNGRWTSSWGEVRLTVKDGKVSGTWAEGGVEGTAQDDGSVVLTWSHRDGTVGRAALKANDEFSALSGTWGFDTADTGEGEWSLKQVERAEEKALKAKPEPEPEPAAAEAEPSPTSEEPAPADAAAEAPAPETGKKKK